MNTSLPPNGPLEVRDADGRVVGYFVPADEFTRLSREVDTLRRERDTFERQLHSVLPAATPEQEEEFRQALEHGVWTDESAISQIIDGLRGGHGNQ